MKTKYALRHLEILSKNFSITKNSEDNNLNYIKFGNKTFFCVNNQIGFVIVDKDLCDTLYNSYGINDKKTIIELLNLFFRKFHFFTYVFDIYILDFKIFND